MLRLKLLFLALSLSIVTGMAFMRIVDRLLL